jgi:hypothetical protein
VNKEQALQIIVMAAEAAPLNKAQHIQVAEAISIIQKALSPEVKDDTKSD